MPLESMENVSKTRQQEMSFVLWNLVLLVELVGLAPLPRITNHDKELCCPIRITMPSLDIHFYPIVAGSIYSKLPHAIAFKIPLYLPCSRAALDDM